LGVKGLAAALRTIALAAPGLREAGVVSLRLEGLGEIVLARPQAAPGPRPALANTTDSPSARARAVLQQAGGLSPEQTDDLMADLRRFD
jgi:hypothetical protein